MWNRRSPVLACLTLTLAWWRQPAAADGPVAAPSAAIAVRQGFSPYGMALTGDGRYAYLSFDLSPFVFKVRLSDMTVVASADFSRYFPLECSTIALDAAEAKVFLLDHSQGRLLVLNASTLQEIRVIAGFPVSGGAQLVRSRWGPYLILPWAGAWLINTDTLEVTTTAKSQGFFFIRESPTDPAIWYAAASKPGSTEIGTYDYKKGVWAV